MKRVFGIVALNIILSLLAILFVLLLLKLDTFWPALMPTWVKPVAWVLFIPGSSLIIWAVVALAKHSGTSGAPGDPTQNLVVTGPYRRLRNPIYAGDVLLVFGVAFFTSSPTLLLASFLLLPLLDLYVRRVEEPRTEQRLGDAYREYKQHVPRWIPKRKVRNDE